MKREDKEKALKEAQTIIDNAPYTHTIPYPYCCVCFERLTPDTIVTQLNENGEEELWDFCLECKQRETVHE